MFYMISIAYNLIHVLMYFWFLDAIYAVVQSARQVAAAEMVRGAPWQVEEEDYPRADHHSAGKEA